MCGHGMVASKLTKVVMERVKAGKMTPEKGAHLLAQPCPCGIFNTDRCEQILDAVHGKEIRMERAAEGFYMADPPLGEERCSITNNKRERR